jgi:hypothetical protein
MSTSDHLLEAGPIEASAAKPRREHTRHHHRFRLALVGLVALCVASLGAAIALSGNTRTTTSASNWSAWSPPDPGLQGAQDIADFVAPYYRATPATQLAVVTVLDLNNPNNPLQIVVPSNGSSGSLVPLPTTGTVVYNLCGTGTGDCAIGAGTPSAARLLLLRREALELALYTFKYISGTQTVVAILPPGHTVTGCTGICPKPQTGTATRPVNLALAFDRSELAPWLSRPLRQTLPGDLPPTVAQMPAAPEAELVSVITAHGLFQERVEAAQDGSNVIVLNQMPPQ